MQKIRFIITIIFIGVFFVFLTNVYADVIDADSFEPNVSMSATAEYDTTFSSAFEFDTSTGTITKYTSPAAIVVIPNQINGVDVKKIGDSAFEYCKNLEEVTIPNSVSSIGYSAFFNCNNLRKITIPNSVSSIGYWAFSGCSSLTEITIPNSVSSIGYRLFANCSSLTKITIPNSISSIDEGVFANCSSLTEVTIPNSVSSIGDGVFTNCEKLETVYCYKNSTADNLSLYPHSTNVKFHYLDDMINFNVKNAEGKSGEEVDIYISVDDNPGLSLYDLKVNFDKTKLTPVSITQINSDEINGGLVSNLNKPNVNKPLLDYVTAVWNNASNVTYNGDLFKIRFKIKEDVLYSELPITIEFNEDGLLNENYDNLTPKITNGKITVYPPYEFGDINMDNKINGKDLLMLTQYLAEYNNITLNSSQLYLADVYKDGSVDLLDLVLLKQYLAGWDDIILGQEAVNTVSLWNDDSINLDLNSEAISEDEIKVNVIANDNSGIAAFKFKLNYDNAVLQPVSVKKGTALVSGDLTTNIKSITEDNTYLTALWSDTSNSTENGVLYEVTFKIKDKSAADTKLSIQCASKDIINENLQIVTTDETEQTINLK